MKRKRVIIDTDAGIDDALALLLAAASPEIEIVAITVSSGNCAVAQGVKNVLGVMQLASMGKIPVAHGIDVPLVQPLLLAPETHGEAGLGYAKLPVSKYHASKIHAVDLIVTEVLKTPGEISFVTLGPLTNLAFAIRREPRIVNLINDVFIMGGAIRHAGNATPQAEFNIYCDPHAAYIVFNSGIRITLVPLDVTYQIILKPEHIEPLLKIKSPISYFIDDATRFYIEYHKSYQGIDGCVINDPLALALTFAPKLVNVQKLFVNVDISGGVSMGKTFADFFNFWKRDANISVALSVQAAEFINLFLERISKLALANPRLEN